MFVWGAYVVWSCLVGEFYVVIKSASVIKIRALATSKTSRINKSIWIKTSIAFRFYFCDHDPVARLMLSNKQ